jgi:hypothetical protein
VRLEARDRLVEDRHANAVMKVAANDRAPIRMLAANDEIKLVAEIAVAAARIEVKDERRGRQQPAGCPKSQRTAARIALPITGEGEL